MKIKIVLLYIFIYKQSNFFHKIKKLDEKNQVKV